MVFQFSAFETSLWAFFSWFILLSQMVPISLIVSMEMVKFAMGKFIQWDKTLYYLPINRRTKCNNRCPPPLLFLFRG